MLQHWSDDICCAQKTTFEGNSDILDKKWKMPRRNSYFFGQEMGKKVIDINRVRHNWLPLNS